MSKNNQQFVTLDRSQIRDDYSEMSLEDVENQLQIYSNIIREVNFIKRDLRGHRDHCAALKRILTMERKKKEKEQKK